MSKLADNPYLVGLDLTKSSTLAVHPYFMDLGLTDEEIKRYKQLLTYWRFYKGLHWDKPRPDGEPQVTINYIRAFVDKATAFLAMKGFAINTPPEAEDITKPFLDYVWDDNNRELLFLEMAQMGSITGDVFVRVSFEEYDPEEDPDLYEMYPNGRIRLTVLPTTAVYPRFYAHDRNKIVEVNIIYQILVPDGKNLVPQWYRERITKDVFEEYLGEEKIVQKENPLGFIPIVHIPNIPSAGESFGQSDIKDLIPIQKELNYKLTDISDIINYHAAPITIVKGARISSLERGARKIWGGLPKDADVYNLELQSDLKAALEYINILRTAMFEIGKVPENGLGQKRAISNTSGIALHIENQPLMELTQKKWKTYGKGIQEINRMILRLAEKLETWENENFDREKFKALPLTIRYKTSVEFGNPLPKDELLQLQIIAQKIALNLQSRVDALKELGEYNAKEKYKEILQELAEFNEFLMENDLGATTSSKGARKALETNIGGEVLKEEKADPEAKKDD